MNIIMSRAVQHHHNAHRAAPLSPLSPRNHTAKTCDRFPSKELTIFSETLGSGSFGTVYKGIWRGEIVAVKQFRTREEIDSFSVEVEKLSCIKHPNIVTLHKHYKLVNTGYLVMEYAEGGSLNHLLHENRQQEYDLRHACSWAKQTARGVAYLHSFKPKPIMHRDLKPANLLLFAGGRLLKICDFGTACTVKTQMTNNTGSASYMAPEVFATSNYLESGDVFSWSIIFWEILARRHPYSQQYSNPYQILWRVKQEGARPNELESCPKIIWKLITRSWNKDPQKRPTMAQISKEMDTILSLTGQSTTNNDGSIKFRSPHRTPTTPTSPTSHLSNQHLQQKGVFPILKSEQNQMGFLLNQTTPTTNKRDLLNEIRHKRKKLQLIRDRFDMLEIKCDRRDADAVFDEYKELKRDLEKKQAEIERRLTNASNSHHPD